MQPKQRLPACSQNSARGDVAKLLLQGICRVSIHASDKKLCKHATSRDNCASVYCWLYSIVCGPWRRVVLTLHTAERIALH